MVRLNHTLDRIKRRIRTNMTELVIPDNNGETTQEAAIKKKQSKNTFTNAGNVVNCLFINTALLTSKELISNFLKQYQSTYM